MPELNPLRISVEAEDGTCFEYQAGVYITKEGEFHVDLDERLVDIAEKLPRHTAGVTVNYVARSQKWKLHGKVLGHIATFIRDCATDYLACDKITERKLIYGHKLEVAVWINKDGSLAVNGCDAKDGGGWFKGSDITSTRSVPYYTVGLAAAVYDKTTYKRKSGDTVTWERVRDDKDEAIDQLNSFTCLHVNPERDGSYKEMPYTQEAALFFYNMMMSMCRLAVQMDSFFSSPERVALAINQRALLGPGGTT